MDWLAPTSTIEGLLREDDETYFSIGGTFGQFCEGGRYEFDYIGVTKDERPCDRTEGSVKMLWWFSPPIVFVLLTLRTQSRWKWNQSTPSTNIGIALSQLSSDTNSVLGETAQNGLDDAEEYTRYEMRIIRW